MTLTEEQYGVKIEKLMELGWDIYKFRLHIQCRTTIPNPYCEEELDNAITSMKALLIQLKTNNVSKNNDGSFKEDLNDNDRWWFPNIVKESKAEVTELA